MEAAQESLAANYEELFDVVACYFPVSFTPPPTNVHGITREDLAGALQTTLTCTTLFASLFIPMLLEKLSSSLRSGTNLTKAGVCNVAGLLSACVSHLCEMYLHIFTSYCLSTSNPCMYGINLDILITAHGLAALIRLRSCSAPHVVPY